ncbi:hypothetical protein prwr041_03760 [Prevotella herbatica]|uniref:Uncharacterized protein n=1 Tax=Prevotella herbatica TaxID=2801997 RepID=A0ABN6EEZ0_9BACT|nr:hypothetical protein [Prevotella herbatica]BCS84483.1 hypothetical protein prwr041_03760 [Prevotella herbatica]
MFLETEKALLRNDFFIDNAVFIYISVIYEFSIKTSDIAATFDECRFVPYYTDNQCLVT